MTEFFKNFVFWAYFMIGLLLNISQASMYFDFSHHIGLELLELVGICIFFSFWLTTGVCAGYIICKLIDLIGRLYE